jgi:hypothetical protein
MIQTVNNYVGIQLTTEYVDPLHNSAGKKVQPLLVIYPIRITHERSLVFTNKTSEGNLFYCINVDIMLLMCVRLSGQHFNNSQLYNIEFRL